ALRSRAEDLLDALEPSSEQAYVPAEQPAPCEGPRFPAAHADPCRPRDRRRPPQEGARQPDREPLTHGAAVDSGAGLPARQPVPFLCSRTDPLLSPRNRMRRSAEFGLVMRKGRRAGRESLGVILLAPGTPGTDPPRVGFVVSKAVGGAVVRKRVQ